MGNITYTIAVRDIKILFERRRGLTLQKIGNNLGISRERVRQIVNRALKREMEYKNKLDEMTEISKFIKTEKKSFTTKSKK